MSGKCRVRSPQSHVQSTSVSRTPHFVELGISEKMPSSAFFPFREVRPVIRQRSPGRQFVLFPAQRPPRKPRRRGIERDRRNKLSDDSGTIRRSRQTHPIGRREAANGFPQSRCKSSHKEEATRKQVKSLNMSYLRALLETQNHGNMRSE